MDQSTIRIFFALLRSAIGGQPLQDEERAVYSAASLPALLELGQKHDVVNIVVLALQQNDLLAGADATLQQSCKKRMLKAVYRYEQFHYELTRICEVLEQAEIPFIPLKGTILRQYYPEAWMRTSSDIDILLHRSDLKRAAEELSIALQYTQKGGTPHDISLYSPNGTHIELHFDLVEDNRANNAAPVLRTAWEHTVLHGESHFRYDTSDAFFYFYHIAHMAKHFENGGCGVRPLIDLWLLEQLEDASRVERDALLERGDLLVFANAARKLCRVWFEGAESDEISMKLQSYLLHGGVYGNVENRVAVQQKKRGGKFRYILSRIFVPFALLKTQYPILQRHPWLAPFMQMKRWCNLLKPERAQRAKRELTLSNNLDPRQREETALFLQQIGL